MFLSDVCLESFDMGGTACGINVCSIRIVIDHIGLCTKSIEDTLRNSKGTSVCTVQSDLHIFKGSCRYGNQVSDVTVTSCRIINGSPDIIPCSKRKLRNLSVNVGFDLVLHLCLHLVSFSVDNLDSVIIKWIVACGDHDTTVKIFSTCHVRNTWRRRYMKQVAVRSGSCQSCGKRVLKHVTASSRIFSDHDAGLVFLPVVPSKISSHLERMLYCKAYICFSPESICSKIFTHIRYSFIKFALSADFFAQLCRLFYYIRLCMVLQ